MDVNLPPQNAGTDFDKWLDWNGAADEAGQHRDGLQNNVEANTSLHRSPYPISPSSTLNGDPYLLAPKLHPYTAPSTAGPLTPSHSSGSPEMFPGSHARLSGDTLREDELLYRRSSLKRKLSSSEEGLGPEEQVTRSRPGGSKRPHNVIEKRYRANLNEKIAELRDSVPALRVLQKARSKDTGNGGSDDEDLDGLTPTGKLNKASILTKAVEYIRHLESRNKKLDDENRSLKERLQILDRVIAKGGHDAARATAFTTKEVIEQPSTDPPKKHEPDGKTAPRDKVALPESWTKIRQSQQSTEHYGHVYQNPSERPKFGGKWTSRIMMGSFAALMVVEGVSERDSGTDSREKGLFGIPLEILDGWTFLSSPRTYLATFAEYAQAGGVVPLIKGFMALTILAFLVFTYLFNSRPHSSETPEKEVQEDPQATSPASPIEVRRRAWSTSMQALQLPHHSFFPEWLALTLEWLNYTIRYVIGPQAYTALTGRTADDELARIKNWDIAIDAQLAGGDVEVSRSRLLLTIFGSGTLPQTPLRLMQKALHCRVLLWKVGLPSTAASRLAYYMATYFANRQWRHARQLHERLPSRDGDRLPGYLNYLLQIDCDDVFNDRVTQRASNLMYDRPTSECAEDPLMDVVVEDYAIRSPLDAIAAWRSTSALHEALDAALRNPDAVDLLREHMQAALEIAPPGSAAETRALAVHAVLSPGRRLAFFSKAMDAMSPVSPVVIPDDNAEFSIPYFIDSSTPVSARPEVAACLHCAKVMLTLDQERNIDGAIASMAEATKLHTPSTILTAASQYFVLHRIWRARGATTDLSRCGGVVVELLGYFSSKNTQLDQQLPLSPQSIATAIGFLQMVWPTSIRSPWSRVPSRTQSIVSIDTGYASLSEQEPEEEKQNGLYSTEDISADGDHRAVLTLAV